MNNIVQRIASILAEHSKQLTEMRSRLDTGPAGLSTLQNQFASQQGITKGSDITMSKIYAAIGVAAALLGILVLLSNGVFK